MLGFRIRKRRREVGADLIAQFRTLPVANAVYAAGVTHRGPYKDGPGEINVPTAIDGMVIEPGDPVLGDADGLVCVPFDEAEAVCRAAQDKHRAEDEMMRAIEERRSDRAWVGATLTRLGCEVEA